MKRIYPSKHNLFNRPQISGKQSTLNPNKTTEQATNDLIKAVEVIIKNARWAYYKSPINELRRPLLELHIARNNENKEKQRSQQ